jgi:hypothetical protein
MKIFCSSMMVLVLAVPLALAGTQEDVESYLVAPYTTGKMVTVTMAGGKKVEGKVVSGDDEKITVLQSGGSVNVPVDQIASVELRRPKRSAKLDFIGNMVGGLGFGFAGAAVGKKAAENIRGDHTSGKAGPIVGGVVFGFAGSYLGRYLVRHMAAEQVTLKVVQLGSQKPQALQREPEPAASGAESARTGTTSPAGNSALQSSR